MIELLGGIASVLVPTLIAYTVHIYRPKVGYYVYCASDHFIVNDGKIAQGSGLSSQKIEVGFIELRNPTRSDIEDFEVVFEADVKATNIEVKDSRTLAKRSIVCRTDESGIYISVLNLPAQEEVKLGYSIIESQGLHDVRPKKSKGKFKLYSIEESRQNTQSFFNGLFFSFSLLTLCAILAIPLAYIMSLF